MAQPYEIPIDPALLLEEQAIDNDLEDAEGELVDETPNEGYYGGDQHMGYNNDSHAQEEVIHAMHHGQDGYYGSPAQQNYSDYAPSSSGRPPRSVSRPIPFDELPLINHHSLLQEYPSAPSPSSVPKKRGRPPKSASLLLANGSGPSRPKNVDLAKRPPGKGKGRAVNGNTDSMEGLIRAAGHRDLECSFCSQGEESNRKGVPEAMISCAECGRSGHPSCLRMNESLSRKVKTYRWKCIECKVCEICRVKGEDADLLFCDGCDTGWHSYCLNPPLSKAPTGTWYCPVCQSDRQSKGDPLSSTKAKARPLHDSSHPHRPSSSSSAPRPRGRPRKNLPPIDYSNDDIGIDDENVFADVRPKIKFKPNRHKKQSTAHSTDEDEDGPSSFPRVRIRLRVGSGKGKAMEVESEEEKVPYGGVITGEDADTSKTVITDRDKELFDKARLQAEAKLGGPPPPTAPVPAPISPAPSSVNGYAPTPPPKNPAAAHSAYRPLRNQVLQQTLSISTPIVSTPGSTSAAASGSSMGYAEKIKRIRFGVYDIDTWYSAPYPEEYQHVPDGRLWLCEFCMKYMKTGFVAGRHRMKCKARHPPGDEIYRKGNVSVFEVDGRKNKIYCQNLCLLAKMFLNSKTLYYDVEPFLFYVMTEVDDLGARFVGYFSKEKRSPDNNVSCIMTLPVRQRKGWGQLLIDFSYLLSKKEGRVGGPERPLSALGEVTYKRYWSLSVLAYLHNAPDHPTLEDISKATSMTLEDIYVTLKEQDMIQDLASPPPSEHEMSTPGAWRRGRGRGRGRGSSRLTAPRRSSHNRQEKSAEPDDEPAKVVIPSRYAIRWDRDYVDALLRSHGRKGYLTLAPERLKYHPFLVSRNPAKPPGVLAKATLMANNPNALKAAEVESHGDGHAVDGAGVDSQATEAAAGPDEMTLHGEDQATLDLVQALAHESPQRSLRKRTSAELNSGSTPLESVKRLRSMDRVDRSVSRTPSTRHSRRLGGVQEKLIPSADLTPSRRRRNGAESGKGDSELAAPIELTPSKRRANGTGNGHGDEKSLFGQDADEGHESDDPLQLFTPKANGKAAKANGDSVKSQDAVEKSDVQEVNGEDGLDADGEREEEFLGDEEDAEGEEEDAEGEEDDEYVE